MSTRHDSNAGSNDRNESEPVVTDPTRSALRTIWTFVLFEAAFYVAYRYAMSFSQEIASPFWFPASVLLCTLLVAPPSRWWLFIAGQLPIRLQCAVPDEFSLGFLLAAFAVDSVTALASAKALRNGLKNPLRFETVPELALYGAIAVVLVPALAAFAGAAARYSQGFDYWPAWGQWFMGNALAAAVVTPPLLYWVVGSRVRMPTPSKRVVEAAALVIGVVISGYSAFKTTGPDSVFVGASLYAPIPFLFWAAIRFGMLGASGAVAIFASFAVSALLRSHDHLAVPVSVQPGFALQLFLLLGTAPVYLTAALIQQKHSAEQFLRESESRFRAMADSAPVMIWMAGPDGSCEFVNRGWCEFVGRAADQMDAEVWTQALHADDLERCLSIFHSSLDKRQPFEMDYRLKRCDGEYRWVLDRGTPRYSPTGDFLGYLGSATDITDHKRVEEAYRNLAHVSRLAVVGELTATIVHEINQPLAAILANASAAEILLRGDTPPLTELRAIMADIRKSEAYAQEVILRIRPLLRKQAMQLQLVDIDETVRDVLRLIAGEAMLRRVAIRSESVPRVPLVLGDRVYLQQVLLNLIINGMDAMKNVPQGSRELVVETRMYGDDFVAVAVIDRGFGIATEQLSTIFDSFVTTKEDGMGLGLSIARSIIESHDGRIWAENNPGGGARFQFILRVASSSASPSARMPFVEHDALDEKPSDAA